MDDRLSRCYATLSLRKLAKAFNPDQPRDPPGSSTGGRWSGSAAIRARLAEGPGTAFDRLREKYPR